MKTKLLITNTSTLKNKSMIIKLLFLQLVFASLAFIALSGSVATVFAQDWTQQTALPTCWDLNGVVFLSPTDGFICGEDRVLMRTNDSGATWQQVTGVTRDRLFWEQEFYDLAFADLLHGWAVGNVNYRTTDGGENWLEMASAGGNNAQIQPITADVAYLNSTWQLQKTTDGGVSWTPVFPASGIDRVNAMDWWDDERGVFWGGGYSTGSVSGLRLTLDGGDTWQLRRSGLTNDVTFVTSDVLLWHDHWGFHVYRSDDLGQTASVVLTVADQPIDEIHRLPDGKMLVVDADVRMWLSDDDGLTWTQVRDILGARGLQSPGIHFRDAQNGWFVNDDGLIMQTTDGGYTWTQRQSGIGAILGDVTMYPDGRGVAVGENGAVIVTNDFGEQWTVRPILRGPEDVSIDMARLAQAGGSRLFLASEPGFVYRSDDRGETWTSLPNSPYFPNSIMKALDFVDEQTGYMFGRSYEFGLIYKTSDGGETWQTMMDLYAYEPLQLDAEMFDENNGVSVGSGNSFFFTTDGWENYTHRPIVSAGVAWESIGFANLQVGWVGSFYGLVAHTTDGGLTWTDVYLPGVTNAHIIQAIDAKSENEVYILAAAPDETLVYQSFDGGQTWQVSAPGLQSPDFRSPTYNFFVTDGGDIWTVGYLGFMLARQEATPVGLTSEVTAPSEFSLEQNYPNPFNPVTAINYSIPNSSFVSLTVYNIIGQKVAELVNEFVRAGTHKVSFNASEFSSGVFFYQLNAGSFTNTKKMLLIK
ncbi:MAG: T9SS type A sorting domain-containing protein [Ignavibacteria bacterium]|nr:T9SS type A sorting domain-containing protein [Ignavibacteria bacterium]